MEVVSDFDEGKRGFSLKSLKSFQRGEEKDCFSAKSSNSKSLGPDFHRPRPKITDDDTPSEEGIEKESTSSSIGTLPSQFSKQV